MNDGRQPTTLIAWLAYLGVMVYLANMLGPVAIPFAAIMMVPLIVMMNFLWGGDKERSQKGGEDMARAEKRKRQRIDRLIRDMSDDELHELRHRLQDGSFDEEMFYDHVVGDDGEIVMR